MRFLAYDLSIQLVVELRTTLARIKQHDAALAKQGRDALGSVSLNLGEGNGRAGGDRLQTSASRSVASAKSAPCSMSRSPSAT